jgi:hypothetical protein
VKKDPQVAVRVKEILDLIKKISPGRSVELRIPPYGAIQCVAGSNHKRGTPPNTVEMSAETLFDLVNEPALWLVFCASGRILASGTNSNLLSIFLELGRLKQETRGNF